MSILKSMFTVLDAIIGEHEQLLALAKRKKETLIKNNMGLLSEIVKEETAVAHRLERLESERLGASRLLALRLQTSPESLTASKLLTLAANEDEAVRMRAVTGRLKHLYDEVKGLNELNRQLIQQSLQFVTNSIEILSESPQVPTYGGTGESTNNPYQTGGRTSFFDSKA